MIDTSTKPNFFIVGAAKAGTTLLHGLLSAHPQVYMSSEKELIYFGSDLRDWNPGICFNDEANYLNNFSESGACPVIGESSPQYMLSNLSAREIYDFNPGAKILILLRRPADTLQSLHAHLYLRGMEREKNLHAALARCLVERPDWAALGDEGGQIRRLDYFARVDYGPQVQRFLDIFSPENVCVQFYEELVSDFEPTMRSIEAFLGLDPHLDYRFIMVNRGREVKSHAAHRLMDTTKRLIPVPLFTKKLLRPAYARLRKLNSKEASPAKAEFPSEFLEPLEQINQRLEYALPVSNYWKSFVDC